MSGTTSSPAGTPLERPIGTGVCETCAERGRPNEPVYKMGMCKFCYNGLPHPNASREQLARERAGVAATSPERRSVTPENLADNVDLLLPI